MWGKVKLISAEKKNSEFPLDNFTLASHYSEILSDIEAQTYLKFCFVREDITMLFYWTQLCQNYSKSYHVVAEIFSTDF